MVFFNEFPGVYEENDKDNYKATLEKIVGYEYWDVREACNFIIKTNGKPAVGDCSVALSDYNGMLTIEATDDPKRRYWLDPTKTTQI